jgi:hypothetical protein
MEADGVSPRLDFFQMNVPREHKNTVNTVQPISCERKIHHFPFIHRLAVPVRVTIQSQYQGMRFFLLRLGIDNVKDDADNMLATSDVAKKCDAAK